MSEQGQRPGWDFRGRHLGAEVTHHLTLCRTGRYGCWGYCSCGWRSSAWTTTTGAHLEFGRHLVESEEQR